MAGRCAWWGACIAGGRVWRGGACVAGGVHVCMVPPVDRMTDRCKNITLPQLRWKSKVHT